MPEGLVFIAFCGLLGIGAWIAETVIPAWRRWRVRREMARDDVGWQSEGKWR